MNCGCASQCALWVVTGSSARQLVLTLRTTLEALVAVGDAPLQRLVIAGLEVQTIHPLQRAPVAAIGDALNSLNARLPGSGHTAGVQGDQAGGNGAAVTLGDEEQPVFGHGARHAAEKFTVQVGCVVMLQIGALIALVEKVPVRRADLASLQHAKAHPRVGHLAPFLTYFLAFVRCQLV